jgi:hypothetical protein
MLSSNVKAVVQSVTPGNGPLVAMRQKFLDRAAVVFAVMFRDVHDSCGQPSTMGDRAAVFARVRPARPVIVLATGSSRQRKRCDFSAKF